MGADTNRDDLFKNFVEGSSKFSWTLTDQLNLLIEEILTTLDEMPEEEREQKIAQVLSEIDEFFAKFLGRGAEEVPPIFQDYISKLTSGDDSAEDE